MAAAATALAVVAALTLPGPAAAGETPDTTTTTGRAAAAAAPLTPAPPLPDAPLPAAAPVDPSAAPLALGAADRDEAGVRQARSSGPLKLVAVTWTGTAPDTVDVRSSTATEDWGPWTALDLNGAERDDPAARARATQGTEPIWVGDHTRVQVRAARAGTSVTNDVSLVRIDPGTSTNDAAIGRSGRAAEQPAVVTRAQWGADENLMTWTPEVRPSVRAAIVHHTAESNDYGPGDSAAIVRGIYYYHAVTQGWGDIGYNALVDKYGTIFEGRAGGLDKAVVAGHAGGFNTDTFGVAMMGNHVAVPPTAPEIESVARITAWKLAGKDPNAPVGLTSGGGSYTSFPAGRVATVPTLLGHRDVGNTVCPGDAGYATLGAIRARVVDLSAAGPTTPPSTTPPSTTTPIAPTNPLYDYGPGEKVLIEGTTPDGRGRYNVYANRSVYYSATSGGWEIYGAIRDYWTSLGWETSALGYPTSNEYDIRGGRQQNFEHGVLRWIAATGVVDQPSV